MKKKPLLLLGCLLLLSGWFSAFVLNSLPQHNSLYILGPTLLLSGGMGLIHKMVGWKKTAIALVFTAMAGVLLLNQLFPEKSVSISAFKQRMKDGAKGTMTPLDVQEKDRLGPFVVARQLEVFADVKIQLYAHLPGVPGMMTVDPDGHLYVTMPALGAVYRLTDENSDGFADQSSLFYVGLDRPSGIVWSEGKLYVAQPEQLLELSDSDGDGQADQLRVVVDGFPDDGGHWRRAVVADKDGSLYLSIGSRCNACVEKNQLRGTVLKIDPVAAKISIFAWGLRHTIGLALSPTDGTLWGGDVGRDGLGAQLPPDEINQIVADGNYGWPYCYGDKIVDPQLGSQAICQKTQASRFDLPARSEPLGIVFGKLLKAPRKYRNNLYVTLHGYPSGKNSTAGKLVTIPYRNGGLSDHGKEFIRGWGTGEQSWGAPAAVVVGRDGSLYVSDDKAQVIYRVSWKKKMDEK